MEEPKILENLHEVFETGEVPLKADMKSNMEKIDRLKEEAMKYSEK